MNKEAEEEEKNDKEEEEVPSTAGEKKRPSEDSEDSPPAKKLCTEEGETSNVPCEVHLLICLANCPFLCGYWETCKKNLSA